MKKKGKIALLVISLFFVLVFGALVMGHFYNIKVEAYQLTPDKPLSDHLIDYIPVVRNYMWIAYTVAISLLIVFSILAGLAAGMLKQSKKVVIIKKKITAPKKTKNTKTEAVPATPIKTKVNF
jgi:uncharacterized protein YneF (UPF0154 family)